MGVNVMLLTVVKELPNSVCFNDYKTFDTTEDYCMTKRKDAFYKKYDSFKNMQMIEYDSLIETLTNQGHTDLDINTIEYVDSRVNQEVHGEFDEYIDIYYDTSKNIHYNVKDSEYVRSMKAHYYIETLIEEEFKGQYKQDVFWQGTRLDDWDEDNERPDAIDVIEDQETLNFIKTLFDETAPIQNWELRENQIVYLSW